jgi:hypothetical protein
MKEPDPYYPEPAQITREQEMALAEARLDYCHALYSMEMKRKEVLETKVQFYLSLVTLFLGAILLKLEFLQFLQTALAQNKSMIWLNLIISLSTLALGLSVLTSLVCILMALRLQNYRNPSFIPLADKLFHPDSPYKDKLILLRDVAAMYAFATEHNAEQNCQKTGWIKLTSTSVLSLIISLTILMGAVTFLLLSSPQNVNHNEMSMTEMLIRQSL